VTKSRKPIQATATVDGSKRKRRSSTEERQSEYARRRQERFAAWFWSLGGSAIVVRTQQ
jgi:hypothetical protein